MSEPKSESFLTKNPCISSEPASSVKSTVARQFALENQQLLEQSSAKIHHCLGQLDLAQIWWRPTKPLNSIGNLILHVSGNLRQWAIAGVGKQPDSRDRQAEFDRMDPIEAEKLLRMLETTVDEANGVIRAVADDRWSELVTIQGFQVSILQAISHTCTHFVGHTHQIILLTRMQLCDTYQFHWTPDSDQSSMTL